MRIGIIAEDLSDFEVLRTLTRRMLLPHEVGFSRFVGHGCGKLRRKCRAWAEILVRKGCSFIVVVHDLDRNDRRILRRQLEDAVAGLSAQGTIVLIPMAEIEAWLLYDNQALGKAFRRTKCPKLPGNPESLPDPKSTLARLVWRIYKRRYVTTLHNARIAEHVRIALLKRATSFAPYRPFIKRVVAAMD